MHTWYAHIINLAYISCNYIAYVVIKNSKATSSIMRIASSHDVTCVLSIILRHGRVLHTVLYYTRHEQWPTCA